MFKKLAGIAGIGLVVVMFAGTGCGKKFTCKNFCEKQKKCASALVKVMSEGVPKDMEAKIKENMTKRFENIEKCTKSCDRHWKETDKKSNKAKKAIEKCYKKSSCDDFAKCLKAVR